MIDWTPELIDQICGLISEGNGIADIEGRDGVPSADSIYRKMASDEAFAARIARAREAQQDREVDKCIIIADEATPENWQAKKLQIWARQWRASKLAPKKYGDKIDHNHSGGLTVNITR